MSIVRSYRHLLIPGAMLLLLAIGLITLMVLFIRRNDNQEQPLSNDDIYVSVPSHSGAFDRDPHWLTSFDLLGFQGLQDFGRLQTADPALDPWANFGSGPYVLLIPSDGSGGWSVAVGHGFVSVQIDETISLYLDTVGLEEKLLRQGIDNGYLQEMQRIYGGQRDVSELAP